jgi:lipid-A-disaccharide synthase
MKYYLIAGEASGDLHGSNLMLHVQQLDDQADFRYWGGDKMAHVGGVLVEHYRNMAFMGFVEVIKNLRTILGFIKRCKRDILIFRPDVLILIDYPGFNLRIAKWAKKKGIKVVYYITPQVWAWHKSRVHDLGRYTDKLLVILPFESDFFKKYGYQAMYVGHPLLDAFDNFRPDPAFQQYTENSAKILALLPGSRKQEINIMLPVMLEAVQDQDYKILLAGAPSVDDDLYDAIIAKMNMSHKVQLIRNQTYDILTVADVALVSSGTATLETAIFKVPQVVCYKGSPISYFIAKRLVDLKYISLVNLIAGEEVVKELIQNELTPENIRKELDILNKNRQTITLNYENLRSKLGNKGASFRAAQQVIQIFQDS